MRCRIAILCLVLGALAGAMMQPQDQKADSDRRVITHVAPSYPDLARTMNLQGIVKLRVTVAPDGTVKTTQVVGGNPVLAKSAQDAVSRWKWAPAPHESTESVELRFSPNQ
jgi:TonB family protein